MPAPTSNRFITSLSRPTAAASTPGPANGIPAVFSNPCTDPSSPYGPCNTGNTTSSFCSAAGADMLGRAGTESG